MCLVWCALCMLLKYNGRQHNIIYGYMTTFRIQAFLLFLLKIPRSCGERVMQSTCQNMRKSAQKKFVCFGVFFAKSQMKLKRRSRAKRTESGAMRHACKREMHDIDCPYFSDCFLINKNEKVLFSVVGISLGKNGQ